MGFGVVVLLFWAWRAFPKGHMVRRGAGLSLFFTITEGLVGAWLVLAELTAGDTSAARAVSISVHLVNTLLLVASITLTAWYASGGELPRHRLMSRWGFWFSLAWLGMAILGVTGAITALGDTLFPSGSLVEGLQNDLSPVAHFLIRLRVIHPFVAVIVGGYLAGMSLNLRKTSTGRNIRLLTLTQVGLFGVQIVLGMINLILLAPVAMQLVHLFVMDLVWINLVILSAVHFSGQGSQVLSPFQGEELNSLSHTE
jgi:heme A synthase